MVESMAWRMSLRSMRRRTSAMIKAPTAPMAPPSVGVAMPKKMVPSTKKIRPRGGIITKVTRSAILDSRPRPLTRLATDAKKAMPTPTHMEVTINSSNGTLSGRDLAKNKAARVEKTTRASKDGKPELPSFSRMVRASGGRAGTHWGRIKLKTRM